MPTPPLADWRTEFGLDGRAPPSLFTGKGELAATFPQAHLLHRAFDALGVDAVLCVDHTPLAYFKVVKRIGPPAVAELHRQFWNHGGAALLVLVTDDRVHVYSGMTPPEGGTGGVAAQPAEVESLPRLADPLKALVVAVESGEFFRRHPRSFNPMKRVDRHLLDSLQHTRLELTSVTKPIPPPVLNALLCRLVFTCYLFDRGVIGDRYLSDLGVPAADLRELLREMAPAAAREALYRLFERLKEDFNGDLFGTDLAAEKRLVRDDHMRALNTFLQGMTVGSGQRVLFRLYDFKFIPIETISAIYERFLDAGERSKGAYYTPRFLVEVVLDLALDGIGPLLGKRFLDPACGSGIFLVGLFNRLAEEWRRAHPTARNDRRARELMRLLRQSLFGVDVSPTACRITAFSLYLAYLDQLSPPDIQGLQATGHALPRLVAPAAEDGQPGEGGNIREADFFTADAPVPTGVDLVVGNPPWGSFATAETPAGRWCATNGRPLPDNQIAAAFVWKAVRHAGEDGRACLVLPHGVLFNHSDAALDFQRAWVRSHALERVLNLADYQRFLFETAERPAVVVSYRKRPPADTDQRIEYWGPKADWTVTKAEVISVGPQDRSTFTVGEVLRDLGGPDAPQIWKQRFWATPRDRRLLDRLALYPRLRDRVRQSRDRASGKPWLMAEGFQPLGSGDDRDEAVRLRLPSRAFIPAVSNVIDLFLLPGDCDQFPLAETVVRKRSNKNTQVFRGPHVIVSHGFSRIAFADFDVSFQHALRGIGAPVEDRPLLVFLAAYLRTPLARYYLFHTSHNWGVGIQKAHVEEVLALPFPPPESKRTRQIVETVARIVDSAARKADADFVDRAGVVRSASAEIEPLVNEYFDIIPYEQNLIDDTVRVVIDSTRPTRGTKCIPTLEPATPGQRTAYCDRVCELLNGWAGDGPDAVRGQAVGSETLGVGVALFEKVSRVQAAAPVAGLDRGLLATLDAVRRLVPQAHSTLDLVRGVMVFDGPRLYVVKPIGQRYWTLTAAMNDADEIAGTILMRSAQGGA